MNWVRSGVGVKQVSDPYQKYNDGAKRCQPRSARRSALASCPSSTLKGVSTTGGTHDQLELFPLHLYNEGHS